MDQEQKQLVINTIKKILPQHADVNSIESYTKHYFWKYYQMCLKNNQPFTLDGFCEKIPDACLVPAKQREAEFKKKHATLLEILDSETEKENQKPEKPKK